MAATDQLVDEMVVRFTHTVEMDWMLPGIAPTGKRVEVALVVIVRFRDGKLAHEHIYWDQASVLAQLGLINTATLPVCGGDTARKAGCVPSCTNLADRVETPVCRRRRPIFDRFGRRTN